MLDNQFTPPGVHRNVLMLPLPRPQPQPRPRFLFKAQSQHRMELQALGLAECSQQLLREGFTSLPKEWLIFPRPSPSSAPTTCSWNGHTHGCVLIAFLLPLESVTLRMIAAAVLLPQDSPNSIKQRGQPQFHEQMQPAVGTAAFFRGPDFSPPQLPCHICPSPFSHAKVS